jgi:hypothetical protein
MGDLSTLQRIPRESQSSREAQERTGLQDSADPGLLSLHRLFLYPHLVSGYLSSICSQAGTMSRQVPGTVKGADMLASLKELQPWTDNWSHAYTSSRQAGSMCCLHIDN